MKQAVKPQAAAPAKHSAKKVLSNNKKAKRQMAAGAPKLPRGRVGKGLKYDNVGDGIQKRLSKKSPWYTSIHDPLHGADVKIPDETGIETGTLQLVEKHIIKASPFNGVASDGATGFRIYTPYINRASIGGSTALVGSNMQYLKDNATDYDQWGWADDTSVFQVGMAGPFDGIDEIIQITNEHRIVSACLIVQPEAALSTNQGEYCLFFAPFGNLGGTSYDDYVNHYKSIVIPVSDSQAGIVRWIPFARNDWNFKSFIRTDATDIDYDDTGDDCPFWGLGCVMSGVEPGTVFRVTIVVNYEFVPKYNTLNILDAKPSPNDATEVDLVENWVQDMDVGTTVPQRVASSSPSSAPVQHGDNDSGTGFGMFFNVISELAPLALALL